MRAERTDAAEKQPKKRRRRKNLTRDERERVIIEEAINLFSERGFDASLSDLAARLGVTQPLIFRYFPTKQHLIDAVYQELYLGKWNPGWEALITDRSIPLRDRLITFYSEYTSTVHSNGTWIRIFFYSALRDVDITKRYLSMIRESFLKPLCVELRHHYGLPTISPRAVSQREYEIAWGLHSSFVYIAVRRYIFGTTTPRNLKPVIEDRVQLFLDGTGPALERIVSEGQ